MVTFDASFLEEKDKIKDLLLNGMSVARINCAHDNPEIWLKLINQLKKDCQELQLSCKVFMDLAGPKIRTTILGKGSENGKVKIREGKEFLLADSDATFKTDDIVIGCTLPHITRFVKLGERIMFDDGAMKAMVVEKTDYMLKLKMMRNSKKSLALKANKGINFPDSELDVPSLIEYDK